MLDFRKELKPGLKKPKLKLRSRKTLQQIKILRREKTPTATKKSSLETEQARNYTEEGIHSAEEAKVILLKTKKDSEEAIAKFKFEAKQANAILKKHKEAA